jgi:rod shape-determining protein MreC
MFKKIFSRKKLTFISIVLLIIIAYFFGFLRPLEQGVQKLFNWSSYRLASLRPSENFYQCQESEEIINLLQSELEKVTINETELEILKEENEKLRNYFNWQEEKAYKLELTNIVSRELDLGLKAQEQNLLIDKGRNDGLVVGLAVISENGAIVGKITDVKENSAQLCLITSRNCRLASTILNNNRSVGLTDGELGLTVSLNMIPQTEEIEIGQIVISSGLSQFIPRGLVIGRVNQLEKKANEIWQNAIIEPAVSFNNLNILAVVLP